MSKRTDRRLIFIILPMLACTGEPKVDDSPDTPPHTHTDPPDTQTDSQTDSRTDTPTDTQTDTGTTQPEPDPEPLLTIAVLGDYGMDNDAQASVAALIDTWAPDIVLTVGDNNYPRGEAETIDDNIGRYFSQYIHPYVGEYGEGAEENAFYPCPGNHDWYGPDGLEPYTEYFELPGNERYYQVTLGEGGVLDVFCVDSDIHEPDGITADSVQAEWLRNALAESTATWRFVTLHHAPRSSGVHGDNATLQWPYGSWGADAVFAGHDHDYERVIHDQSIYMVNGAGGASLRSVQTPTEGTQVWNVTHHGAQRIRIYGDWMTSEFIGIGGEIIDQFHMHAAHSLGWTEHAIGKGSAWRYLDTGVAPDDEWTSVDYDDTAWAEGAAPLGYGNPDVLTPIDGGEDETNRPITTWLRHRFTVDDPDAFEAATLHLRRDDGALVYLNGTLVMRSNLPESVTAETLATEAIEDDAEGEFVSETLNPDLLVAGENVIAIELHQASPDSDDLLVDFILEVQRGDELIASGSAWQWNTEATEDWARSDFDAAEWSVGDSPLGYGTTNGLSPTTEGAQTTWFRHEFEVADPDAYEALLLQTKRDDGARILINGTEVLRSNLPAGELTDESLAVSPVEGVWQENWVSSHINPSVLVVGTNVIGIEIHQAEIDDVDMTMDVVLIGR